MTTTKYFDASAPGGGDGSQGNPYNSLLQAAPGGVFPDSMVLYARPGATIPAVFSGTWTLPVDANLTIRPYGSGNGRPSFTFTGRGFLSQGSGSVDYQDVDFYGTTEGSAAIARTGGSVSIVNSDIHGFSTSIKCGTGTIYIRNVWCDKPARNGLQVDADPNSAICTSVQALDSLFTAAQPTSQDLLVLHAGGYGVCPGAILDGVQVESLAGSYIESGIDIQEQFKGAIVRNFEVIGASQWGFVMGSLFKTSVPYVFTTKSLMLAAFTREGIGSGAYDINGGHCVFVTADGANNGIWQLTGNNPNFAASWTGPMTPTDLAANPNLIYSGLFQSCVAGVQIQHPGTQIAGVSFLDTTLGNWIGETASGSGNTLSVYPFGYDAKAEDCVFSSLDGKYPEIVSVGAGQIGVPSGNYLTSVRSAVRVQALNAQIAQRTRLTLTGSIVRQRSYHTGPFIELVSANDRGYLLSNYNAYVDETGPRTTFASDAGSNVTFAAFKTSNGNSDANSQYLTAAVALVDDECRLLDSSPLIGAGVARSGLSGTIPNVDAEGNAISSPPDIGAYRYLSEAAAAAVRATPRRLMRAQRIPG